VQLTFVEEIGRDGRKL